jgi:oligoendopeptidase F
MRHAPPADAAASQQSAEVLPNWDLSDLYPAPDSPQVEADFAKAEQSARAFAAAHQGRLATLPGGALAAAISEYEQIEEVLGRLMSYAQLLFSGDSTSAEIGRFYQTVSERVTAISSHLLFFSLELNRLDDSTLEQRFADPELARWRPWLRDLRVFRPHQLSDELEKLLHEKEVTGRSAWSRLFDETIAGMRVPVGGEELTVSAALNKLSDRDRSAREAAGRRSVRRECAAVLVDHQHAGEGQGDRRYVAPLSAPWQLPQPRQHGGRRSRGRAGFGSAGGISAAGPSVLPDEGEVARAAETATLGSQCAIAG